MKNFKIRDMECCDYEIFKEFYTELHRLHFENMPTIFREQVSMPPREVFEKDLQSPDRTAFIAEVNGQAAGMCLMSFKSIPNDTNYPLLPHSIAHIDELYTAPAFRRQGIASMMYREAERRGKEHGADKMQLQVWCFNESAMALYRKLGMNPLFCKMEKKL